METNEKWLERFKVKIKEGYENNRMDKRLCEFAHEVDKPAKTLWKYDQPFSAQTIPAGQEMNIIPMASPKLRTVEPLQVGIRIDGLRSWNFENDGWGLESLMFRNGSTVAEREYWAIVKGMSDNAGKTIKARNKGEVSELDIREAKSWIGQNGRAYADTIVMPIQQETDLLMRGNCGYLTKYLLVTCQRKIEDRITLDGLVELMSIGCGFSKTSFWFLQNVGVLLAIHRLKYILTNQKDLPISLLKNGVLQLQCLNKQL